MLTEQEIMNNAFKEMLAHEESMAKKYAQLSQQITDPKIQQTIKGMEQGARNHFSTVTNDV
jgi:benzoyl-CoA reductase/2-hydroxyglutaryl-CoA dehydratase subunit BcrC/BadD/HgdB